MQVLYAPEAAGDAVHVVVVVHATEIKDKHLLPVGVYAFKNKFLFNTFKCSVFNA